MSTKTYQIRRVLVAALLGGALLGLYVASTALAVHDEGFQLEGNVQSGDLTFVDHDLVGTPPKEVDTPGTLTGNFAGQYDWAGANGLFNDDGSKKALPDGFIASDFERDFKTDSNGLYVTSDPTTFATGSKDGLPISGWQCNTDNNVNSKIDISNGYAGVFDAPFFDPNTSSTTHRFLVFGMEKDVDNGSNNIGIWLLKDNTVGCDGSAGTATFSGVHTAGDVLIVSAFSKGGGVSTISAYVWADDIDPKKAGNQPGVNPTPIAASADCLDVAGSGVADQICATIDGKPIQVPWPTAQDSVAVATNGTINVPNFVEGGIDLTALHLDEGSGQCFNRFIMDTRSSPSIPATLFDYVQGNLPTCHPSVTLTKTPNVTDVCTGSSTSVTYTYVVTNSGNVGITNGKIVDDNGTPADTSDDRTITVGSIAAGGTATVTDTRAVTGTTTNTAVFTGTTIAGSVTATATATVTGHTCTISLTKTAGTKDVCTGSNTSILYTYVVKNTGNFFNASGSITDDKNGTIGNFGPLAPGASATLTKTVTVTGSVTNIGTASATFDDAASTTATATATATVTGHTCTISLTKTASPTDVCTGSNTSILYTYVVKNTGNFFNASGSITDDKNGTIGNFGPLAPGASATLTKTVTVTGSVTNIGTASATFDDAASTTATATATATVTGHTCTISLTKTASPTDVCTGSNTSILYTYVVKNTGNFFNASGSITDDKNGTIGNFGPLAPGASATLTKTVTVTGSVTNIGTASATFDDAASTTATATATATVTGHTCTISLTKTASPTDVCTGSNTSILYTYVVKNTGNFFNASGSITDDKNGTIGNFGPLAPGASATLTKTVTVTGSVTNIGTASATFDDAASTTATATATATVTAHTCPISLTKTVSPTTVCSGSNTPVTYTYKVTNGSDTFTWTGSLTDDKNGTIAATITLAPGASQTFTANANISVTTTNTATASGTFNDPAGTSASAQASATVTANPCATSQLAPTTTTCQQFRDGTAGIENVVSYGVKSNKINNVAPGVLFYYTKFQVSSSGTVVVHLTQTMGDALPFFGAQSVQIFTGTCGTVSGATIDSTNPADITITLTNVTNGDSFIANIKIDPGTIVGSPAPSPTTVNFSYSTVIGGNTLTSAAGTIVKTH